MSGIIGNFYTIIKRIPCFKINIISSHTPAYIHISVNYSILIWEGIQGMEDLGREIDLNRQKY